MSPGYFPAYVDSTMLADFKACPTKFRFAHMQDWKPKVVSVHLHAGAAYARGLEVARRAFFEQNDSPERAQDLGAAALAEAYGDFIAPMRGSGAAKTKDGMIGAYNFYWSNYPFSTDDAPILMANGRRAIEFNFASPLPVRHPITGDPLIYAGRFDQIMSYQGLVMGEDDKTTTSLGPSWTQQWDLRSQFTSYCWGAQEMGIKLDGFLIRGVSILKSKNETQQAITYRPEWQIDRWLEETVLWVEDIIQCWKTGKWRHNLDHACAEYGGCAFREPCMFREEGGFLERDFERRRWNPIDRTETKL